MREGKRKQWVPPYVSHIARTGQFQAFSVLRGPESFGRQNVPVCHGPGAVVRKFWSGRRPEFLAEQPFAWPSAGTAACLPCASLRR